MAKIRIKAGSVCMTATLNDSQTAAGLLDILPIEARASRWGREVYFSTALQLPEEDPQAEAPSGTVAYWPPGNALCIFFGQRPYSPVNVVGRLDGDANAFSRVRDAEPVMVSLEQDASGG